MDFQNTEEQQLLADSVQKLIDKDYDFESRQKVVRSDAGFDEKAWKGLAELGLLALPFSEEDGGFGGGATDLISIMQAMGAGLVVEPFLSTLLAGRLIAKAGTAAQREASLPGVVDGSTKLAFAHTDEGVRYDVDEVLASATQTSKGWKLSARKIVVLHAPMADKLVVSARTDGGTGKGGAVSLFVVDPKAKGVKLKTFRTIDNLRAADIDFDGVELPADALLGDAPGKAGPIIEEAVDFATVLLCCEAVGAMHFANETTLEYLKTRKQFGVPIGSFQALQHRMVDMTISARQSESICMLAATRVDGAVRGEVEPAERRRVVSAAKIKISDACRHVGQEAIQLHGGMGMTEELKVSHTFKRLTMIAQQFGDVDQHLERFAAS